METSPITWRSRYEPGVPHGLSPLPGGFPRLVAEAGAAAPGQTALVCYRRRWTYAQVEARAMRAAQALIRLGLRPGERVAVALPNLPVACEVMLGVLRAGGVVLSLPWGADRAVVEGALEACPPRFVVTADGRGGRCVADAAPPGALIFIDLRADLPPLLRWIGRLTRGPVADREAPTRRTPRHRRWERLLAQARSGAEPVLEADAPALEVPRSGGSGCLTFQHGHLTSGAQMLRLWLSDAVPGEDSWLPLLPLGTALGLVLILGAAPLARARVLLLPRWDGDALLHLCRWLPPAYAFSDAATIRRLNDDPHLPELDLDTLRAWVVSEDLAREEAQAFASATGLELCRGLAPEPAAGLLLCNPINGQRAEGSHGLLLPGASARLRPRPGGSAALEFQAPNLAGEGWQALGAALRVDAEGYFFSSDPSSSPAAASSSSSHSSSSSSSHSSSSS